MEPRACVAHWDGDKLTVYTPTGGIANCRHDMARDLGMPDEKVRVVCQYMGGNFGNKNQNQDADLITAMLAKEAGAPVKLELSRKEDFIGVHGRWPTVQYYKVGVDARRHAARRSSCAATAAWARTARTPARSAASSCTSARTSRPSCLPVYTNRTVSGNFRGPEFPQGFFGIQSMMDDVAVQAEDGSGRVRPEEHDADGRATRCRTPTTRSRSASAAAPRRSTGRARWRPQPGSDAGPIKRGAGVSLHGVPRRASAGAAPSFALDAQGQVHACYVGVTDVGAGAKTTMGLIAAEALGVPLSQVEVVWGDTDRCPYSVGESGSRTTIMTGYAVIEAARDLKKQIAEKGLPTGDAGAASRRRRRIRGSRARSRSAFGAHFVEVEVDTELGRVRVTKYVAVHDCGRIINPLTAQRPDSGRRDHGHRHGAARGPALRPPQRAAADGRLLRRAHRRPTATRRRSRSSSSRPTTATGRSARRASARPSISPGAGGGRQRDLQRDRPPHEGSADHARQDSGSARMKAFTNANRPRSRARGHAGAADARRAAGTPSFAGGGSDLLGLVKDRIVTPDVVVNLQGDQGTATRSSRDGAGADDRRPDHARRAQPRIR